MKLSKLQSVINRCIKESMYGSMLDDQFIDVLEDVKTEFHSGQTHQSWKLVPARDLKLLWAKFAKYSRVDEELMDKIWSILRVTVLKILINSDVKDGNLADSFFEKDSYKEITDEEWERWFTFISDKSGSNRVRNFGEIGSGGNGRYSDRAKTVYKYADAAERETNPDQKIIKIDTLLNFIHGLGSMAHWFVEGGESTLDSIRDYSAKGIVNTGTINESFLDAFENSLAGKKNYVEIFINPTNRELNEITAHDQYGLILSGKNAYVWNRDLAYHFQIRTFLGSRIDNNYVCILVYVEGNKVSLLVTDDTIKSTWHHNPKIEEFIYNHPFFKHKTIIEVLYWDENIVGSWKNLVVENENGNVVYHVTPKKNLPSIKQQGIIPSALAPADVSDEKVIYLFKDKIEMEDALMNWLGQKFDEDEPLVILTIDTDGLDLVPSSAGYEVMSYRPIPYNRIKNIDDV